MVRHGGLLLAALCAFSGLMVAQEGGHFDVALNGAAVISKHSQGNGTIDAPTSSGAFLATFRVRMTPKHSLLINYGHSRNSQIYTVPPNDYRIQAIVSEYTGAYVFSPMESKRFEPFFLAGAGVLKFNPYDTFIDAVQVGVPAVQQTEVAFLYGAGFDYHIFSSIPFIRRLPSEHLALRLQYRGLIYKAPDFSVPGLFTGARGHMAEPSVGIVVKF
ncbi:MAG: hypothetical protein JOY93_09855 [Acidobacteriales bacterium]|nr:hypothetical protein [Terriglobales bacterium]